MATRIDVNPEGVLHRYIKEVTFSAPFTGTSSSPTLTYPNTIIISYKAFDY
jgi:hypothetical protein